MNILFKLIFLSVLLIGICYTSKECSPGKELKDDAVLPVKKCPNDCNSNGECNRFEGTCLCQDGFRGDDCSERLLMERELKNQKLSKEERAKLKAEREKRKKEKEEERAQKKILNELRKKEREEEKAKRNAEKQEREKNKAEVKARKEQEKKIREAQKELNAKKKAEREAEKARKKAEQEEKKKQKELYKNKFNGKGNKEVKSNNTLDAIVEPIRMCAGGCSGNGVCDVHSNECICGPGFRGKNCAKEISCLNNCSGNGFCDPYTGKCFCSHGFKGKDCSDASKNPHINPKYKSYILEKALWTTANASELNATDISVNATNLQEECPNNCSSPNGFCNIILGNCHCHYGYKGKDCSEKVTCPNNCSSNGFCNKFNGKCICKFKFTGEDCSKKIVCENDCSGNGYCLKLVGKCFCYSGYGGADCSVKN